MAYVFSHVHDALLLIADQVGATGVLQAVRVRLLRRDLGEPAILLHQLKDANSADRRSLQAGKQRTWADSPLADPGPDGKRRGRHHGILSRGGPLQSVDQNPVQFQRRARTVVGKLEFLDLWGSQPVLVEQAEDG